MDSEAVTFTLGASAPGDMSLTLVIGVLGAIMAACALGLTFYEGVQNRRHNRISVTPHVSANSLMTENGFRLELANSGLGPAIISGITLHIKGENVDWNDTNALENRGFEALPKLRGLTVYSNFRHQAIEPGGCVSLIDATAEGELSKLEFDAWYNAFRALSLSGTYKSMYEEKYTFRWKLGDLPK